MQVPIQHRSTMPKQIRAAMLAILQHMAGVFSALTQPCRDS